MDSNEFVKWVKGYVEVSGEEAPNKDKWKRILARLEDVVDVEPIVISNPDPLPSPSVPHYPLITPCDPFIAPFNPYPIITYGNPPHTNLCNRDVDRDICITADVMPMVDDVSV
jgi:hypothetical protein